MSWFKKTPCRLNTPKQQLTISNENAPICDYF